MLASAAATMVSAQIAREPRMLGKVPAWKFRPRRPCGARLPVLLTAVFAVLMMMAVGSAQACPLSDRQAGVESAGASVIQAHRLGPIASAGLKTAPAKLGQIDQQGCCGGNHSECAAFAGGCGTACFAAIDSPHVVFGLEHGPSCRAVGKQGACVTRRPPPDFRPPRA